MVKSTYETLIYHQKQAFKEWKAEFGAGASTLKPEIESAVWELLVLCADNLTSPSIDIDEEITKVAYDLAAAVPAASLAPIISGDVRNLNRIYRDALILSILKYTTLDEDTNYRMIHFSNLLSDAFQEASSDRLRRTISEQRAARISEEMQLAKRIQERLLPRSVPDIPGFQIAGKVMPASQVGGDYWSAKYYEEDDIVTFKLADITGHGIAAATLVAAVKFISGGYYRGASSAHEVIERTNRVLVLETPVEILVTMVYGWLHPKTGEIEIVNAGHEPVFICRENQCMDIPPTGPLLGVSETKYSEQQIKLSTGDVLFFCSDGITEAGIGEPFGVKRVKELVVANRDRSASEIADSITQSVMEYAVQQHDDVSLVVVKAI